MSGGRRRLLFEASAPVRATLGELRDLIDEGWLAQALGWGEVPAGTGPRSGRGIARATGMLSLQGGWWYRGEYTAEQRGSEVRLVHRVYNVARQGLWVVALANRLFLGYRAAMQSGVDDLARRANEHLAARENG